MFCIYEWVNLFSKKDWYVSVKSLAMLNSFSNITRGINDSVIIYEQKTVGAPSPDTDPNASANYTQYLITLDEGNPNVIDLQRQINNKLTAITK